jgi:HK97 gp10 family phage protein
MIEAEIVWNIIPSYTARANVAAEAIQRRALEKIAERARELVAVETGETRDSIEVTDEGVEVGGAGRFLEYGTVYMPAEPFLGPATSQVQESFALEFRASLDGL